MPKMRLVGRPPPVAPPPQGAGMAVPSAVWQQGAPVTVRLVIFGDSWARSMMNDLRTWPELLADRLEWGSINAAISGCDSSRLGMQFELLKAMLAETGASIHENAWALIHAGGNDLMRTVSENFLGFAATATGSALCCLSPCCCRIASFEEVADNVEALIHRLDEELGIRNVILVGMPLTPATPFIGQLLETVFARRPCLVGVAKFVLWRLNATYNRTLARRLQHFNRSCGESASHGVVLDEAAAIDTCVGNKALGLTGNAMWIDGIHPTQLGHEALADEMFFRLKGLAGPAALDSACEPLRSHGFGCSDSEGEE